MYQLCITIGGKKHCLPAFRNKGEYFSYLRREADIKHPVSFVKNNNFD